MKKAKRRIHEFRLSGNDIRVAERHLAQFMYFLTQEEVVRTSVLSKPWRYIWCTRPVLNFSDAAFKGDKQEFIDVIDKNLQRYYDQRVCVNEFHLRISKGYLNHESYYLLEKWIRTLTVISIKKFRLSNRTENGFVHYLPPVVFEVRSLEDLHVEICTPDEKVHGRIVFSKHLKKLHLEKVYTRDEVFHKVISSSPFAAIKTMSIDSCKGLRNVNITNLRNLNNFSFCTKPSAYDHDERCSIEIHPPSLETVKITYGDLRFRRGADFCSLDELYRPRNIGGYDLRRNIDDIECVRKIVMQRQSGNKLNQFSPLWFRDLEDVRLEIYDKNRNEWIATSVSELPRFKETEYNYIRFALKWR